MGDHHPTIVYDIQRDGIGLGPIFVCVMIATGFGVLFGVVLNERRRGRSFGGGVIMLGLVALLGGWGGGNVFYQHLRCVAWARSGAFAVTEGRHGLPSATSK